jgi:hypothetical protein
MIASRKEHKGLPVEPIADFQWLSGWQGTALSADTAADPSFRTLKETRLREGLSFQCQSGETRQILQEQAVRIGAALTAAQGEIRFLLPATVVWRDERNGEKYITETPPDFRDQTVAGFLNRFPAKDVRSAFRGRLSQLEHSGYSAVQAAAGLLRYAVARHIVDDLVPVEDVPGRRAELAAGRQSAALSTEKEGCLPGAAPDDPAALEGIRESDELILRLQRGLNTLHQAVSLAPYMYADEEYLFKQNVLLARLISAGHAVAHQHVLRIVDQIRRRAGADDLNRGLWLSVPYFDDRALEMKLREFDVIPPGRTFFIPAFVAVAAAREQENVEKQESLSPATRMHLLAELKCLEQAFGGRLD